MFGGRHSTCQTSIHRRKRFRSTNVSDARLTQLAITHRQYRWENVPSHRWIFPERIAKVIGCGKGARRIQIARRQITPRLAARRAFGHLHCHLGVIRLRRCIKRLRSAVLNRVRRPRAGGAHATNRRRRTRRLAMKPAPCTLEPLRTRHGSHTPRETREVCAISQAAMFSNAKEVLFKGSNFKRDFAPKANSRSLQRK